MKSNPLHNRQDIRICHVRGLPPTAPPQPGAAIHKSFDLGRLALAAESAGDLAPQVAAVAEEQSLTLNGANWAKPKGRTVAWNRYRIIVPGGGMVDVRVLSTPWISLKDCIALLDDLNYETIQGEPSAWDKTYVEDPGGTVDNIYPFHQLVLPPDEQEEPSWETIQRLIYRADLDAIEEQSSISHPEELNRRPGQLAAVGRFGSVLWGLQDYIETSAILSTAMTVSAVSRASAIRMSAYEQLRDVRRNSSNFTAQDLAALQRSISHLGADLTFGAEAHAAIAHLLPSLRVDSFHRAVFSAADVRAQIELAARMLDRIAGILSAEAVGMA